MNDVLVIGGMGYAGADICEIVRKDGHKVTCLDIDLFNKKTILSNIDYIEENIIGFNNYIDFNLS